MVWAARAALLKKWSRAVNHVLHSTLLARINYNVMSQYSDIAVQNEVQVQFPPLSKTRFAPYTPHIQQVVHIVYHADIPPQRLLQNFHKDVILLTRNNGESVQRRTRSALYDSGRIGNVEPFY